MMKTEELKLVQEWDKTFPKSDKVNHSKVTFVNHFGITLAADMYVPKDTEGKLPAIAVSGPFGVALVHRRLCEKLFAAAHYSLNVRPFYFIEGWSRLLFGNLTTTNKSPTDFLHDLHTFFNRP